MSSYLLGIILSIGFWRYLIIFLAMILEGDIFLFTSFFLAHEGAFNVLKLIAIILPGVVLGDLVWYWVGVKIDKTNSKLQLWAERIATPFDSHLISRTFHTIFLSKFTYGLHHAILLRTGMLRYPLRRFIGYDFVSTIIWIIIVGGLGYFSSYSFSLVKHYIKFAEIGLLLGILMFVFVSHYISKKSKEII
jgi:membrane protein DedA with SNARE-associated domain